VLDHAAAERAVELPRGNWIDFWTHERVTGGGAVSASAPLGRIPVWVRDGALIATYPAADVARGLGEEDPARPIEATLWGRPSLGRAHVRLADGTRIGWHAGEWSVDRPRPVTFSVV
jgi:hypothetical protein